MHPNPHVENAIIKHKVADQLPILKTLIHRVDSRFGNKLSKHLESKFRKHITGKSDLAFYIILKLSTMTKYKRNFAYRKTIAQSALKGLQA